MANNTENPSKVRVHCDKVDQERYKFLTGERLKLLADIAGPDTSPNLIIQRINTILYDTSIECVPKQTKKSKRSNKSHWYPQVKPLVTAAKRAHWECKTANKMKSLSHPLH